MDTGLLQETLIWIAFSGGSGVLAFYLWEQLERWSEKVKAVPSDAETYITLAMTGTFATIAYLATVALEYVALPATTGDWIEALFGVFGAAIGVTTVLHGAKKYRERKK
ncbi:MAG: hypothetical protein ACXAEN_14325 [Candidatus Thorarchaeota archaeon]|jgi:hypothetical protein